MKSIGGVPKASIGTRIVVGSNGNIEENFVPPSNFDVVNLIVALMPSGSLGVFPLDLMKKM